jgi:hypothetical protein
MKVLAAIPAINGTDSNWLGEVRPILDKYLENGYHLDTRLIEKYLEELREL